MAQPYYGAHKPTICPFVSHFPAENQAGIQKCLIVRNLSSLCGNSGQKEVIRYQNFQQVKNNNKKINGTLSRAFTVSGKVVKPLARSRIPGSATLKQAIGWPFSTR